MALLLQYRGALYRRAHESVASILEGLLQDFMASGTYRMVCDINEGDCLDFAEIGVEKLRAVDHDAEFRHSAWLEEVVARKFFKVDPDDLDWDWEVQNLDFKYSLPVHAWIELDGKVYDAEAIDGRDHWYELPLFQRFFKKRPKFKSVYGVP